MVRYDYDVLVRKALVIIANNFKADEPISGLKFSAFLNTSPPTAYRVLYYLQSLGYLDQNLKPQVEKIKEELKKQGS